MQPRETASRQGTGRTMEKKGQRNELAIYKLQE